MERRKSGGRTPEKAKARLSAGKMFFISIFSVIDALLMHSITAKCHEITNSLKKKDKFYQILTKTDP